MTGIQNKSAVLRNEKCSTRCHAGDLSASSYIAGRCQVTFTKIKADQQKIGCETKRAALRTISDERNGPTPLIEKLRGSPDKSGRYGAPQRISGGATIINSKC